ncbi:hypothetical protein EIP75_10940 [Aquabacterium soli]|uniref:DUF3298 domain-containing protein n=1 Tax=Aquabacterium soli TaxID=2493092 RepID=A0A3R8T264_9BURK|nr:hypothetical protein [Aquabacterium soli]RRS04395.1 hypothetical protein EIP75_10940 [Aquabacterium soli]
MACTPRLRLAERTVRLASTLLAACGVWAALPSSAAPASGPVVKAVATAPAWQGVWEGRLAGQPIVMALYLNEQGRWTGRYFYERFGRDLGLWGPVPDADAGSSDTLALQECAPDYGIADAPCERPRATWSLTLAGTSAKGQWQVSSPTARFVPATVSLTRVADYAPTAGALTDPYEQRRLKGIRGQRMPGGQLGPVAWETLSDARSKVAAPQFTRGASPAALQRINDQLKTQWQERIGQALTALDHDDQVDVAFANQRWLALTYSVGFYFAGAAHPSNGFTATTYDLSTGQAVDWSRWFRFTAPGTEAVDFERRDLLAAQALKAFAAQVTALPPDVPSATSDQARCARLVLAHYECRGGRCTRGDLTGGRVPDGWQIWPTAPGLAVAPDVYAEVDRGCRGQPVVLPWAQVRASLLRPQALP